MFTYRVSCQNPFRIEGIGKEFFRNGRQQQLESDLSNTASKITFSNRILLFLRCNPIKQLPVLQSSAANFFETVIFARLARPIQQIFIRSIRSRGTEHPNSIERRSWNLVGHKWSSNISPGNWFVKFKAITPVVNFHEFFSCFLDTWMNSWMKFFSTLCHPWRRTSKTSSVVGANLETSSSWQIKNNHSNSR